MEMKVEPTVKYKYSPVASGATPIGSACRAPDKIKIAWKSRFLKTSRKEVLQLEPTTKYKYSPVASGATPIGSAGRAPGEDATSRRNDNIATQVLKR